MVTRDVPDYALVTGNPGRIRGWMCACGIKLPLAANAAEETAECPSCGAAYHKQGQLVVPVQLAVHA